MRNVYFVTLQTEGNSCHIANTFLTNIRRHIIIRRSCLLPLSHYILDTKMAPKTIESKNYKVEKHRDGSQTIYTKMKIGLGPVRLTFYVKHEYVPKLNSLTVRPGKLPFHYVDCTLFLSFSRLLQWTLDYENYKSDLDDSCGCWYVQS